MRSAPAPAATKKDKPTPSTSAIAAKEAAALQAKKDLEGKAGVQLGITVKKDAAVFGDWYSQVSSCLLLLLLVFVTLWSASNEGKGEGMEQKERCDADE